MFVGLMMILVPVEAADEFRAVAYDCTTPSSIKQFSAEAHCKNAPQVSGEMKKVMILQHVTNEQSAKSQLIGNHITVVFSHTASPY